MRKYVGSLLLVCFCFTVFSGLAWAKVVNRPVAIVNGDIITLKEFEKVSGPVVEQYSVVFTGEDREEKIKELKADILNQMIEEKILIQEAEKKEIKVTKIDIDDGIKEIKERFTSEEEFETELERQNLTKKEFRTKIKESLLVKKLIEQEVEAKVETPSDEEIKNYYQERKGDFERPDQIRVSHILIKIGKDVDFKEKSRALNSIRDIQRQLKEGTDFAELAKKYSEDPGSKNNGGDVGFFAKGMMVKEFEEAAFKLKKGEISDIVETDFGYHIIKFEEEKPGKQLGLEDELGLAGQAIKIKDFIEETILRERLEKKFSEWLKNVKDTAKIEIREIEE